MKIKLHHVNVCSKNVPGLEEFYRDVLDLAPEPSLEAGRILDKQGYPGKRRLPLRRHHAVSPGREGLRHHFRTGQAINPVERGHIAFRTDDIEAFKKRLKEKGIPFSDYGAWAMKGWEQIFFHDPEGNVIEVHQVRESAAIGGPPKCADPPGNAAQYLRYCALHRRRTVQYPRAWPRIPSRPLLSVAAAHH